VHGWLLVSILHSYFIGEGKYQYDVILLVQSYFFTKPRRLIDKPAAGKRKENSYPSFNAKGKKCLRAKAKKKNKTIKNLLPPYYSQSSQFTHTHFSYVRKRQSSYSLRGEYQNLSISDPVDTLCSIPFFKDVDPSVDKTHQAKMKLSADFLAASTPSPSVCFPFGRQANLRHRPSTFVV
jgi:hypothetical protein